MNKRNRIILIVWAVVASLMLSACLGIAPKEVEEIEYGGERYKIGVQGDKNGNGYLHNVGLAVPDASPAYVKDGWRFWESEKYSFDIMYCDHEDSVLWDPYVYVKVSDYEEAYAFYRDVDNYDFYVGKLWGEPVLVGDESLSGRLEEVLNLSGKGPDRETIAVKDGVSEEHYVVCRYSKDGLFCRGNGPELVLFEGRFYCFEGYDGAKDETTLGSISDETNEFLFGVLQAYGVI